METVAKRDTSFDSIKFVLIALVVLGHTMHVDLSGFNGKVFSFIYSFHMPAFAIISGYFFKVKGNKDFWKSILELMLVLIFFQLFYFTNDWHNPFNYSIVGALDRVAHFYIPRGATWYIMSLCFWRIGLQYTPPVILLIISGLYLYCRLFSRSRQVLFQ